MKIKRINWNYRSERVADRGWNNFSIIYSKTYTVSLHLSGNDHMIIKMNHIDAPPLKNDAKGIPFNISYGDARIEHKMIIIILTI